MKWRKCRKRKQNVFQLTVFRWDWLRVWLVDYRLVPPVWPFVSLLIPVVTVVVIIVAVIVVVVVTSTVLCRGKELLSVT